MVCGAGWRGEGSPTASPAFDPAWRAANASGSLWSRTLTGNATSANAMVGSAKRPTQTTARRLGYGATRTDADDCFASRGRHHCLDNRIHRISGYAAEQATCASHPRSGFHLRIDGRRDAARQASRPHNARSSGVHCCGITSSTGTARTHGRSSGNPRDGIRLSNETEPFATSVRRLPDERYCPSVSDSAARYCSSTCGVGSAA